MMSANSAETLKMESNYDNELFTVPPDFDKAKMHGESNKVRFFRKGLDRSKCQCYCWKNISPEFSTQIALWDSPILLIQYGDAFPLMFHFLKFLILLLWAIFVFQGGLFLILIIIYFSSGYTSEGVTYANYFSLHLIVGTDLDQNLTFIYAYDSINMMTLLLIIFCVCIFWIKQVKYQRELDEHDKTDADFAVFVRNLPRNAKNSHIISAFGRAGISKDNIVYINRWYDFGNILKLKYSEIYWTEKYKHLKAFRKWKEEQRAKRDQVFDFTNILEWRSGKLQRCRNPNRWAISTNQAY